ncbi:MAG TPA: metal-dependent hydrolase [Gemmatimonadaceae bacterium]|nr:metal-dependent hydrolase [Gemmatimonadaceae bacterium]
MPSRHSSTSNLARRVATVALLTAAVAPHAATQLRTPTARNAIGVQWLGHAAFEITSPGGTKILIDPFLSANPSTPDSLKRLARYKPDAILVTHSHDDHALDAKAISQLSSSTKVISTYEWINAHGFPASQAMGGNVGGTFRIGDVTIHLVPAMHSSDPGGRPLGFVLEFADHRTLYHTGDTWLFGDMDLIQEFYRPNIILIGVGGGPYTMDPRMAQRAIDKYFKPQAIVPMHYGTFEGLATATDVRVRFAGDRRVTIMTPGQKLFF